MAIFHYRTIIPAIEIKKGIWGIFLFLLSLFSFSQQNVIDSLETRVQRVEGSEKGEVLLLLSEQYMRVNPDESVEYGNKALDISIEVNDSLLWAKSKDNLGKVYYSKGEYGKAVELMEEAKEVYEKIGNEWKTAAAISKIGVFKMEQGEYLVSLDFLLQSLKVFKQLGDSVPIGRIYINLANVHQALGNYDKSISYSKSAIGIFSELHHAEGLASSYGNLALAYEKKGNIEKALEYNKRTYHLFDSLGYRRNAAIALNNIGYFYRKIGNNAKGLEYYQRALKLAAESKDESGEAFYLTNIASIQTDMGQYEKAIENYQQALKVGKENEFLDMIRKVYGGLSDVYEKKGDFQKALEYKKLNQTLKDSILNVEKMKQINELQTKYETAEKELKIESLEREKAVQELENQRQQKFIFLLLLSLVVIGATGGFYLYKKQQDHKNQLKEQEITFQRRLLKETIEAQEEERQRIAKDLHDGVGQQLGVVKLALESLETEDNKTSMKLKEISGTLDDTADEVRNISHQMMPKVLSEQGLIHAIDDMLEKTFRYNSKIDYSFQHYGLDSRPDKQVEIGLFRICQELINNIVKHSGASFVSVQLLKSGEQLALIVEDNGKGFKEEEAKGGIGMKTIESRINSISGKINFEPSPDAGTVATVRVPLHG